MSKKPIMIIILAVVVVAGLGFLIFHKSPTKAVVITSSATTPTKTTTTPTTSSNSTSTAPAASSSTTTTPSPMSVTVNANDGSASPDTINASKGQKVTITFAVSTNGTYHGGLDFKSDSPSIDSGNIPEGSSKSVTFTANQSFQFTPFWYASNVQKDYFVTVKVS